MSKLEGISRVKQIIGNNNFPPDYQPEQWQDLKYYTNCYAYALNSLYADKQPNSLYYVGAFSAYEWQECFTDEELIERLFADFAALGLKIRESNLYESVPENGYKICFLASWYDYHFFRYDKQGFWSHKQGWRDLPQNNYRGDIITDPDNAKGGDRILGYYIISR